MTPLGPIEVGAAHLYSTDAQPLGEGDPSSRWVHALSPLADRVGDPVSKTRSVSPFGQRVTLLPARRVLFTGDAAGLLDSLIGEGIRLG